MSTTCFNAKAVALVFALQACTPALACRIGRDQNLFDVPPPQNALTGAEIIHVRVANKLISKVDQVEGEESAGTRLYSPIGLGWIVSKGIAIGEPFPIYAQVTSCTDLRDGLAPLGDFYLIGHFVVDKRGRRFYAGGRRVDNSGQSMFPGWHF